MDTTAGSPSYKQAAPRTGARQIMSNSLDVYKLFLLTSMIKFPFVFSKNGILNSSIAITAIGSICTFTSLYIIKEITNKLIETSYTGISSKIMGKYTAPLVSAAVFGLRVLGILYSIDLSVKFMKTTTFLSGMSGIHTLISLFVILFLMGVLFKSPERLSFTGARGLVTFLLLLSVTVFSYIRHVGDNESRIQFINRGKSFDSLGLTAICFTPHFNAVPVLNNIQNQAGILSLFIGCVAATLSYIAVGLAGYAAYPDTEVNWLANIKSNEVRDILATTLLLINIVSYPLLLMPVRESYKDFLATFLKIKLPDFIVTFLLTAMLVFPSVCFVATSYGATICLVFSSLVMLIIPSVLYLKMHSENRKSKFLAYTNLLVGLALLFRSGMDILEISK